MPRRRSTRRTVAISSAVACLLVALTACQPPPTRFVFEVNADPGAPDASPGDGTCADATGGCNLTAAVQEANASGPADLVLTTATPEFADHDLVVTGDVRILGRRIPFRRTTITVEPGGKLHLDRIAFTSADEGGRSLEVVVEGDLTTDESAFPGIHVASGGRAVLMRSFVRSDPDQLAANADVVVDGTFAATNSTIETTLVTNPGGASTLRASIVRSCSGTTPTSLGHNAGAVIRCGLTQPTDLFFPRLNRAEGEFSYSIDPDDPAVDHVPVGVANCGVAPALAFDPPLVAGDRNGDGELGCQPGWTQTVGTA
jgi:hypothetical protein